jgi:peptide/nickel transport system permease protein
MYKILQMLLKRIAQSVVVLLIVTLMVFLAMQALPGNPIQIFLGATATPEQIEHYTRLFGYDKPVMVQYGKWIAGLFHGEMGRSVMLQREISGILFQRLGTTLMIVLPAFVVAIIFGLFFGITAALNRGKTVDSIVSFFANIGMAMPLFWLGIICILVFSLKLHILPVQGFVAPSKDLVEYIRHAVMPVGILSLGPLALFARQTRSAMLDVIRQDYVRTAQAKGLNRWGIIIKHQLHNALIPIITVMGVQLGFMIGGTVLIESIFVVPGLGNLMISSIQSKDFMVVQNGVLVIAVAVCVCNLIVDLLYGIIDPRIRDSK